MGAKDTVMSLFQRNKFHNWGWLKGKTIEDRDKAICEAQAEISFKAGYLEGKKDGIREVVEWAKTGECAVTDTLHRTFSFNVETLHAKLREWGVDKPKK